jgi:hypothetical protein
MSTKSIANIATIGVDIGKNSFHVADRDTRRERAVAELVTRPDRSAAACNALIGAEASVIALSRKL